MRSVARLVAIVVACSLPVAAAGPAPARPEPLAVQDPSAAAAERLLIENLNDLSGAYYPMPCSADGEPLPPAERDLVRLEGKIYERLSAVTDGAGGVHVAVNTMPVGVRGTLVSTGEGFRVSEEFRSLANLRTTGDSGSFRWTLKMVGLETRRTYWLVQSGNYRVAGDGTVVVDRGVFAIQCRA